MNTHPEWEKFGDWLLGHSLQAGLLVLLVLAVQWLFPRRLTSRWRFMLWWIVLARLLLPFNPSSALSVFNLFHPVVHLETASAPAIIKASAPNDSPQDNTFVSAAPPSSPSPSSQITPVQVSQALSPSTLPASIPVATTRSFTSMAAQATPSARDWKTQIVPALALFWLAGLLGMSGVVAMQIIRFQRKLARATVPSDGQLQVLLDDCRRDFGISRRVELFETDAVSSPALFGFWRLRLLLPRALGSQFSSRELRYIFLHELAHVKRGDLWLNWLVTVLQIIHWFNPLLWLGFARLRADRELACDELALLRTGDEAGADYGATIVKLLENLSRPAAIPGLVGILEDRQQMRRRITMIASFRNSRRWPILAVILFAAVAVAALTDAQSTQAPAPPVAATSSVDSSGQPTAVIAGTVTAKNGVPLTVPATIFIATAGPRTGTSTFCPSCYADCTKQAGTDAQGHFQIASLDDQLVFQILAVAKGYQPQYVSKVDPSSHAPLKIELKPIAASNAAPDHMVQGRVVNSTGQPVVGAVVQMKGIQTKDGGGTWGNLPGVDPLAVTDEHGDFVLTSQREFDTMDVVVSARKFADRRFRQLSDGNIHNQLVLTEGAALTGQVMQNGKPLANVMVGVSGVDRDTMKFLGHFEVGSGDNGRFAFLNLPPDGDFYLYALMDSLKGAGAPVIARVHTGKDGESTDTGRLDVVPGHRLTGRVVLADGQPIPPKTRLLISREDAWDSLQVTLDADGNFDAPNIPSEIVTLSVRIKHEHVSPKNHSLDELNPYRLEGLVNRDITNLVVLMEPGPDIKPEYNSLDPDSDRRRNRPLQGSEGGEDHSGDWVISGHVLDAATRQPLPQFTVIPGRINFDRANWNPLQSETASNGVYQVYISHHASQPVLQIQADGYLPASMTLQAENATNIDFVLQKGSGPTGNVVTADGRPASDVTLVLLTSAENQANFTAAGKLTTFMSQTSQQITDASGSFTLKPMLDAKWIAAASPDGFAYLTLEKLAANPKIVLQPLGRITGTLKRASGPGMNEILGISLLAEDGGRTYIRLQHQTRTDAAGNFSFENVPAGTVAIWSRKPVENNPDSWTEEPLSSTGVNPGQLAVVKINAPDRKTNEGNEFPPITPSRLVPGVQIKGVVLLPDGQPAAGANVAVQVPNKYLGLDHGDFQQGAREQGVVVTAGQDGSFTLPMYEGALSVIALNDQGYSQVSLARLKTTPQITLQKWGRIEGTLFQGRNPDTNDSINLSFPMHPMYRASTLPPAMTPPFYGDSFRVRTDSAGHFAMNFVPPGKQIISRMMAIEGNSLRGSSLALVNVEAGAILVTNLGGGGRTVVGTLKFPDGVDVVPAEGHVEIHNSNTQFRLKTAALKTQEERQAYFQSDEYQTMLMNNRNYPARVKSDGSFRAEDVPPGRYEIGYQQIHTMQHETTSKIFTAPQEIVIPDPKDKNDDSVVDLGTIELKKWQMPVVH